MAHAATGAQPSTGKQESGRKGRFPSCFDEDFQEPWDPWIEDAEDVEPPVGEWYFGADELRWPREEGSQGVGQKKEECSPFIPAEKFMGMKECMAFKTGPQGLGYYTDTGSKVAAVNVSQEQAAIKLKLAVLVPSPGEGKTSQKMGRKKRLQRRRRKPRKRRAESLYVDTESTESSMASNTGQSGGSTDTWTTASQTASLDSDVDMDSIATAEHGSTAGDNVSSDGEAAGSDAGTQHEAKSGNEEEVSEDEQEEAGTSRDWWVIDTVNANSWGGVVAGSTSRGALDFLQRTVADVVVVQETRLTGEGKRESAHRAAKTAKWNLLAPAAATTEKGYPSAGVALATRVGFGVAGKITTRVEEHDSTRIAGGHVGILCRGGCTSSASTCTRRRASPSSIRGCSCNWLDW